MNYFDRSFKLPKWSWLGSSWHCLDYCWCWSCLPLIPYYNFFYSKLLPIHDVTIFVDSVALFEISVHAVDAKVSDDSWNIVCVVVAVVKHVYPKILRF